LDAPHPALASGGGREPPGPPGDFLLGNARAVLRDPLRAFVEGCRDHGDVVKFKMGPFDYVLLNSVEGVRHLLVDNHKNYVKSRSYAGLRIVLGEGLVTSEGEHWRRQRKLAQPAFHRERLASFVDAMVSDTAAMLERWDRELVDSRGASTRAFDLHEEMLRLTFRIVGHTLFSVDLDGESSEIGAAIGVALIRANDYAESLVRLPIWLPTPENVRFRRALRVLDRMVYRIIEERRRGAQRGDRQDLLDMLMASTLVPDGENADPKAAPARMTDLQLRDEVMTLVLAGHETTANALSWTWMLLSRHPDVARRLRAEVDEVLEGRAPTLADLPRLKYTSMVVQEGMRLYPPVWVFERQAIEPDSFGGFAVKKGSVVAISPWALHRNPAYWDNPEGFDPERFSEAEIARRPRNAYLPFAVGPRQCIGNAFAMMEAQIIVAMMAQSRRLELVPGHPIVLDPKVTLRPKHGISMRVRRDVGARPSAPGTVLGNAAG
jgi:cytochrome P450